MATDTVQLIFQIRAENRAALAGLRQDISGINTTLQEQLKLSLALVQRGSEQVRQNNEIIASLKGLSGAHQQVAQSSGAAIVKGILYAEVLNKIVSAIKEVTVESTLYAARTQQLNVIMDQLARVNGLSVPAVRATADAVKSLGITTQESREVINRMIFAQLDLSKATDLARLAQNAAKIAGVSSSEALQGIINGIIEQRVQILRTYGVQVQFEQALVRGAATLGKTRDTLTDFERANIALNEVLSKGPRILGTYEVSLSTASGQLQSMTRYVDEAKNAFGEGFIPVLQRVVELLTDSSKNVQENAEQYQNLAKHVTAVGFALAAAKLVPGGPLVKTGVGLAVGIAAEAALDVDPVQQQTKYANAAIEKLEEERRSLLKKFQAGKIADKKDFTDEDQRLNDLELQIQQNLTESLAKEFKKRKELSDKTRQPGLLDNMFDFGQAVSLNAVHDAAKIPAAIKIGGGRQITQQQILDTITQLGKPAAEIQPGDLGVKPDVASQFDAILGQFTTKVKEAQKAASGGVNKAREGLLNGSEKIEQERRDALNKLAEDFQQFIKVFNDTLAHASEIKNDKQREQVIANVKSAQGQYGVAVARINRQYDLELKKDERTDNVAAIIREKKVADARDEAAVDKLRQQSRNSLEIGRAQRPLLFPNEQDSESKAVLKERVDLAQQEYETSKRRAQNDYDTAKKIFDIDKNDKTFADAANTQKISDIKAQAKLLSETSDAELKRQLDIIDIQQKENELIKLRGNLTREYTQDQTKLIIQGNRDAAERAVRLAQAQSTPGNEQNATNIGIEQRVNAAKQDYEISKKNIEDQKESAEAIYLQTADRLDYEKTIGNLRKQALSDAYNYEKSILDARLDKELQIAEIRKQQDQQARQAAGQIYNTLINHQPFSQFLRDFGRSVGQQIAENVGSVALKGVFQQLGTIVPGQQKIDPVTGKPTGELSTLGKIFQGTPLGIDPVQLAQAQHVSAVNRNTKALEDLTGTIGGPGAGNLPIGSNPGAWGGWSGSGGGIQDVVKRVIQSVPRFAEGATVTQPTLGIFGEAGTEHVIPDQSLQDILSKADFVPRWLQNLAGFTSKEQAANTGLSQFDYHLPTNKAELALQAAALIPAGKIIKYLGSEGKMITSISGKEMRAGFHAVDGMAQQGEGVAAWITPAGEYLSSTRDFMQTRIDPEMIMDHEGIANRIATWRKWSKPDEAGIGDLLEKGYVRISPGNGSEGTPATLELKASETSVKNAIKYLGDTAHHSPDVEYEIHSADAAKRIFGSGELREHVIEHLEKLLRSGLPKFGGGGLINDPTLGILGEAGPERVMSVKNYDDPLLKAISKYADASVDNVNATKNLANEISKLNRTLSANKAVLDINKILVRPGGGTSGPLSIGTNPGAWGGWSGIAGPLGPVTLPGGGGGSIPGGGGWSIPGGTSASNGVNGGIYGNSGFGGPGGFNVSDIGTTAALALAATRSTGPLARGTAQSAALRLAFSHIPSLTGKGGIFGPKVDPKTGQPVFSAGQTGLAAALALPQIIGGFEQGGTQGILGGIGGILGVAASIPSPASPFLAAGSAVLSLIAPLLGKTPYQKWQETLNNRLSSKWYLPNSINQISDLAGNSVDFDYRGNIRGYSGQPSTTFNVNVQTMDAKSFMDNSDKIADASRAAIQGGHPLRDTIQDVTGTGQ